MTKTIIKIENLSKQYRLGTIGTGTLSHDLNRWWKTNVLGKEDPYLKIGEANDRAHKGSSEYVWALRDINLEVKEGDVVGIIGKNGAGKSTLLKILSRVTAPTTGSIKVNGRLASLLEVGTGFHPELTGRENIFLNGAILGMTKAEIRSKLDEIIDFSGCERYIDTPVKRYSSGMNVRLGFAVAAFLEPEILVVDEVLAVGDAEFQKKAIGKMQDVSKNHGRTVLFVSHNMASIQALCNTGIIMNNGQVINVGDTRSMIAQYMEINDYQTSLNISQRSDRKGNQSIKIENISFIHTETKHVLDIILSGTPVTVEFDYTCQNPQSIQNVRLAIAFTYSDGSERFVLDNYFTNTQFSNLKNRGKFKCEIKKWPLNQGKYTYRYNLDANNTLADRLENAGSINVDLGDYYGSGIKVAPHLNGVLIDQVWNHN
jgi:lipopolysaccharide transport system ATP-binding protein